MNMSKRIYSLFRMNKGSQYPLIVLLRSMVSHCKKLVGAVWICVNIFALLFFYEICFLSLLNNNSRIIRLVNDFYFWLTLIKFLDKHYTKALT